MGSPASADVDAALDALAARVPVVAIKLGEAGARARAGGEDASAGALAGIAFVDPVGAGDSSTPGSSTRASPDARSSECLRLGVACGTLSTRAAGGVDGQPDLAEALAAAGLDGEPRRAGVSVR